MFVTHSFKIPYEKYLYNDLRTMQRETASVWNDIVREANSYYFATKKWLSKTEIQAVRKQTYNLHSQTVQAIAINMRPIVKPFENYEKRTKKRSIHGEKNTIIVFH